MSSLTTTRGWFAMGFLAPQKSVWKLCSTHRTRRTVFYVHPRCLVSYRCFLCKNMAVKQLEENESTLPRHCSLQATGLHPLPLLGCSRELVPRTVSKPRELSHPRSFLLVSGKSPLLGRARAVSSPFWTQQGHDIPSHGMIKERDRVQVDNAAFRILCQKLQRDGTPTSSSSPRSVGG